MQRVVPRTLPCPLPRDSRPFGPGRPDKRGAALYIKETNPEVAMLNEPVSGRPLTRSLDPGAA